MENVAKYDVARSRKTYQQKWDALRPIFITKLELHLNKAFGIFLPAFCFNYQEVATAFQF